jgi:hypothetical protein
VATNKLGTSAFGKRRLGGIGSTELAEVLALPGNAREGVDWQGEDFRRAPHGQLTAKENLAFNIKLYLNSRLFSIWRSSKGCEQMSFLPLIQRGDLDAGHPERHVGPWRSQARREIPAPIVGNRQTLPKYSPDRSTRSASFRLSNGYLRESVECRRRLFHGLPCRR